MKKIGELCDLKDGGFDWADDGAFQIRLTLHFRGQFYTMGVDLNELNFKTVEGSDKDGRPGRRVELKTLAEKAEYGMELLTKNLLKTLEK